MNHEFIPDYNARGFVLADADIDFRTFEKRITGRMTRLRWKIISRFCRTKSGHQHCGCEWDCCGCLHSQSLSFDYKSGTVLISLTQSFNY